MIASHLHSPVQVIQQQMSSSEFIIWAEFLKQDFNHPDRHDYYLAQIAMEVRRGSMNCRHPNKVKFEDLLMKFEIDKKDEPKTLEEADERSKKFWFALTGYELKDL